MLARLSNRWEYYVSSIENWHKVPFIQRSLEKILPNIAPRKKRMIKMVSSILVLFIIPVFIVHFGYIFSHKEGGLFTALSDISDMRIRNVSVGVYQNGKPIEYTNWHINPDHIKGALPFNTGDYILQTDPQKIREAINNVPWVKNATVKLQLPNHVIISIEENSPYALWQLDGQFYLIDEQGRQITDQNLERYDYLPWVVGEDANLHAKEYIKMMKDFASVFPYVKAAYRVGNRRWNLLLHNNIEVSLSETNPRSSLERLIKLQNKYHILDKQLSNIDLRVANKVFLKRSKHSAVQMLENAG